jgi:DNA polymerase III delta subunit
VAFSLDKALQSRVVLLSGDEGALRARALQEVVSSVTAEDDFDIEHFTGGESKPIEWTASAGTAPFLSERRTVLVRHLLREDEVDSVGWSSLPPFSLLVLVADEESGDESRQSRYTKLRSRWEKAVKDSKGYVEEFKISANQLNESIRQEATRLGKKLSAGAAAILTEMCGGSLSRSLEELEKVALFVGSRDQITEVDVRTVVLPSREYSVFRMTDCALAGDAAEAIRQLRILVGSTTKAEDAGISRILPTMHRQLRLIWQARTIIDAKTSIENAPESVRRQFPESVSILKQQPFVQSKAMKSARAVSLDGVAECLGILGEADCQLKGILAGYSGMETLEQMLLKMVRVVRA